jgi:hypothetical protein
LKAKKVIYIGGAKYVVKIVDRIKKPPGKFGKNVQIFGQFRPKTHEIAYIKGLSSQKNITLVHELLHAISFEFDGNLREEDINLLSRELVGSLSQLGLLQ